MEFRYEKDMREPVVAWLEAQGFVCVREVCSVSYNPIDIVAGRFAERVGRRIPALLDAVAVELKLSDVNGVLAQAVRNRGCVERSFAAIPASKCEKLRPKSIAAFAAEGVGLLSVRRDGLDVILAAQRSAGTDDRVYRNLWRRSGLARKRKPRVLQQLVMETTTEATDMF